MDPLPATLEDIEDVVAQLDSLEKNVRDSLEVINANFQMIHDGLTAMADAIEGDFDALAERVAVLEDKALGTK